MKIFIHKFSNGTVIRLAFDLSKPMPYCQSNLLLDRQPIEILLEYRKWLDAVVIPELSLVLTQDQIINFVCKGMTHLNQLKK